jgi:hypothetical protein
MPIFSLPTTLYAEHLYYYQSQTLDKCTIIATASDQSGVLSTSNDVIYFDGAGVAQNIFTPSLNARPPRAVCSRDYEYFLDGISADNYKWTLVGGSAVSNWGIAAPPSALTVGIATGGGAVVYTLSAAANAVGGNTTYTGTNLQNLSAGTIVQISGFTNAGNNGNFPVVSATGSGPTSTVTVVNSGGITESAAATLVTDNAINPTTLLNGWGAYAHVGSYEGGTNQGYNFATDSSVTAAYTNPGNVFDGSDTTFSYAVGQHTHNYWGCVWSFTNPNKFNNLTLQILSEVPTNGTDGYTSTARSAGLWYSLDGGTSWTQIYNMALRAKQWDAVSLPNGQDLTQVQVMAFLDSHDDMYQKVYTIKILGETTGNGPITLNTGRQYFTVFYSSITGNYSDLSPLSVSTGPVNGGAFPLTNIPVSPDPQVTDVIILATADGGDPSILYFVADVSNGTTIYQDGTPEAQLLLSDIYFFTDDSGNEFGVKDNGLPPNGSYIIKHLGRLWMIDGPLLYFSKSIAELTTPSGIIAGRYEEDWDPQDALDISEDSEIGKGLYSDGQTLYIGTSRQIRRVTGTDPSNFTGPNVVFNEAGILNQDVWQTVFLEGSPLGTMWLTPDYRVLLSDFNTYNDVGVEVQSTLNSINKPYDQTSWAMFLADGPYNLYVLAIPTGSATTPNTLLVFDLHSKQWYTWQLADNLLCALYYMNLSGMPRGVFVDANGIFRVFDKTKVMDRATDTIILSPTGITSTIQTSWLDLGDSNLRKVLNEIETTTTVAGTLISIMGASDSSTFATPNVVLSGAALIQNQFGDYKTFLAGYPTTDRWYKMNWTSTSTTGSSLTDVLLGYYGIEIEPSHRF